jgi:hypothetical protein
MEEIAPKNTIITEVKEIIKRLNSGSNNLMTTHNEAIKRGSFEVIDSSAKARFHKKGDLVLTSENLSINCEGNWSKTIPIGEFDLETHDGKLEIRFGPSRTNFLTLVIADPEKWVEYGKEVESHWLYDYMERVDLMEIERPKELDKLLNMKPEALRKLYNDISKEYNPFQTRSIRFILDMYTTSRNIKNRKLRAFIIAHCYVAFYERTKRLLSKIYKAKFGKGPKNDERLMEFLDNYPSWKFLLDTSEWGIKPNQARNCISHGKFYFDYRNSVFVFMVEKEKRIPLRDLWRIAVPMAHLYSSVTHSIVERAGKIPTS